MIEQLQESLLKCQVADLHRFRARLRKVKKSGSHTAMASLAADMQASQQACEKRSSAIPSTFHYPEQLPFSSKVDEIATLLQKHQVLVVAGDTGSGKTTQLPKICLQAGFGHRGLIGHTQPRRLAAVSVANRIAEEMGVKSGEGVGYQIRFNDNTSPSSFLKLMTDGILLAEIQQDKFLNKYEVLIIDEAHERSLNIDFLLGYLKRLVKQRPELKLIITSATIDVDKFASHFDSAPIVTVSGRTYPVEVRYAPLLTDSDQTDSADSQIDAIGNAISDVVAEDKKRNKLSGDILVFLSTERDIRDTAQFLRKQRLAMTEILPLYSRLKQSEQTKIFKPHGGRRIVLATNVAETSITVPGITYVIDTGLARISRYSLQNKVQRLPIEAISQASADQRKGRCGRVADGICVRLYSENDFKSRPQYTDPEILRTNLASVILRMQYIRLGDVEQFPFIEPPEGKAINEGFKLLAELNALNQSRELTAAGKQMARLPVDPKFARMLVTANSERCLTEMMIIVSALSIQDPRELGVDNRQKAQENLKQFNHDESDFLSFVNLWNSFERTRQQMSQRELHKYCKQNSLSFMRMREWREVHRQLLLGCQQLGFKVNREPADYASVHKAIISGSLNQIAIRFEGKTFQGNRNKKFNLFATSVLANKQTKWIVTGDLIETSQTFATMAAKIEPEWIEEKALHLVKREHFGPHWSKKQQRVMAYEKVSLYGLAIIEKKLVGFANIDAEAARAIFIREGLAAGETTLKGRFIEQNTRLLDELAKQEDKIRKPEHFVSENDVVRFYDQRIPQNLSATAEFSAWLKSAPKRAVDALTMNVDDLLPQSAAEGSHSYQANFPDSAAVHRNKLAIDYVFEPGNERDGATVTIPLAMLPQMEQADIDWAVPGIIREKCIALLKALPKAMRKNFIPVSGFVDQILPQMVAGETSLVEALRAQIRLHKRIDLDRALFSTVALPEHLKIKVTVTDGAGAELAFGEDVESLKVELAGAAEPGGEIAEADVAPLHHLERSGCLGWDFGELPAQVEIGDELVLVRYPALVDESEAVGIKLYSDPYKAEEMHREGLLRLYLLRSSEQRRMVTKQFKKFKQDNALRVPQGLEQFDSYAVSAVYRAAFDISERDVRSQQQFDQVLAEGKQALFVTAQTLEKLLIEIFRSYRAVMQSVSRLTDPALAYAKQDIEAQLKSLLAGDFLLQTPWKWVKHYPRYLAAISKRLERAPHLGPKDELHSAEVQSYWSRYTKWCDQGHIENREEIDLLRWMIEEYRVSLFAQSLGTSIPVSARRLDKLIEKISQ